MGPLRGSWRWLLARESSLWQRRPAENNLISVPTAEDLDIMSLTVQTGHLEILALLLMLMFLLNCRTPHALIDFDALVADSDLAKDGSEE